MDERQFRSQLDGAAALLSSFEVRTTFVIPCCYRQEALEFSRDYQKLVIQLQARSACFGKAFDIQSLNFACMGFFI